MKNLRTCRSPYQAASAAILVLLTLASTGCEEQHSKANESVLRAASDGTPGSFLAKLGAEQAQCPRKINDHTTLIGVSLKSPTHIKYLYLVSESGRLKVNMTTQGEVTEQIMELAKSSHLGPLIVKKRLDVDHHFQDTDGKCLLLKEMSASDYKHLEFEEPQAIVSGPPPDASSDDDADRHLMLSILKSEQAKCPREINEHTTLTEIEQRGINRIKYHYVVRDPGLPRMADNESEIRAEVIAWMQSNPLASSIDKLDMGMEHFYTTSEGTCAMWMHMTSTDLKTGQTAEPKTEVIAEPEAEATAESEPEATAESEPEATAEPEPETTDTQVTPEKAWMPKKIQAAPRTPGNPAAVQTNPYFE